MKNLFVAGALSLAIAPGGLARAQHPGDQKLLIVHSYAKDDVCGAPQAKGVIDALRARGWNPDGDLIVRSYYMDTKKTNTSPEAIRRQAKIVLDEIEAFRPAVVVVLDDNAIREVMLPLVGRQDLAVVFSGMNGQVEDYNQRKHFMATRERPGANVTGVYEKLHVNKSLTVMGAALSGFGPGDKVVGITDHTATGNAITRQFDVELSGHTGSPDWELRRVRDFSEYKALIKELNGEPRVRAIYPAALSLRTGAGEVYTPPQIFAWTTAHSRKPEMALNYYFAKIGLFGGAAVDFEAMGRMAGERAAAILSGAPAGSLPIEDAKDYAIVFNLKRARALGLEIPAALLTAADHVYRQ